MRPTWLEIALGAIRDNVAPPCGLGVNDANTSNGFMITWLP